MTLLRLMMSLLPYHGGEDIRFWSDETAAAKTTTMKMLTGLLYPTHGQAYIFGSSVETGVSN